MKFLRLAARWLVPPVLAVASFAIGYLAFYSGLAGSKLTDGSARSFQETAARIDDGRMLEKASPLERVGWLLEICAQPRSLKRDHALFAAIQQMQPADFMTAITDLPELSKWMASMDADLRADVIQACIERWMDVDEAGLLRWLPIAQGVLESKTWKLPKISERDLGAIYSVMARRKPGWMFEQLQNLGSKTRRTAALRAVIQSAAEAGLPQAEQWLASIKGQPDYLPARRTYLRAIARSDPERALTLALAEPTGSPDFATQLICDCGYEKPDLATSLLEKLDEKERLEAARKLANIIASNPSYDAFKWLDEQGARRPLFLEDLARELMANLAARDPARTMEWIQTIPEARREYAYRDALGAWAGSEPKTLLAWLNAHPDSPALQHIAFFGQLPVVDPDGFAQWIAKLPPGDVQRYARSNFADQMLRQGRAADAARLFPVDGAEQDPVLAVRIVGFGYQLPNSNPQEATRWLEGLPPGKVRAGAASGVVGQWVQLAPAEATQWAEKLPPGELRDASAGAIVQNLAPQDFDGAAAWLSEIQNQAARDRFATLMFQQWQGRRPAQTRAWLRELPGVSAPVRQRLLQSLP